MKNTEIKEIKEMLLIVIEIQVPCAVKSFTALAIFSTNYVKGQQLWYMSF